MNVLIGCEKSGVIRDAFLALGHSATSCDLEFVDHPRHLCGDLLHYIHPRYKWDLLIAHPPCTYLAVSNNGPMSRGCSKYTAAEAQTLRASAIEFFMALVNAPIPRICIENPVGIMSTLYRRPDQIIQPYEYGDDASKKTCLWLKNLPLLTPTSRIPGRMVTCRGRLVERWSNQTDSGQNRLPPSPDRSDLRSRTYPGIASAMSRQWTTP